LIVANNIPIDIYGKTEKDYTGKTSGKQFSWKTEYLPTEPYEKYGFSIVIEENKSNAFFSEKPITCLMSKCLPIYFGCDNIYDITEDTLLLTGNLARDMNLIVDILKKPEQYYKEIDTKKIYKKVNLLRNVKNIFSKV
jgi:hypothetical protein